MKEKTVDYFKDKIYEAIDTFSKSNLILSKSTKIYHDSVKEVINEILEIPRGKRTYDLNMVLVNACLIVKDKTTALITLIENNRQDDPMWYNYMGLCFYGDGKIKMETMALNYFNKFMEYVKEGKIYDGDLINNVRMMINLNNKKMK
jgi:hypothetical protein